MTADLRVEVLSALGGLGLRAQFVFTGPRASAVYQRIRLTPDPRVIGEPAVAEFEGAGILEEILRCIPIPKRGGMDDNLGEVTVPWESAMLVASGPESRIAAEICAQNEWDGLPETLASVLAPLRGSCCVLITSECGTRLRHWIYGDRGWVELGLVEGCVQLIPIRRADMERRLIADLAAAAGWAHSRVA